MIVTETRARRKLLSFVRGEAKDANRTLRQKERLARKQNHVPADPFHPDRIFPPLPKTAVMLRKPATTRFASSSDMLEAFIRLRDVLGKVIINAEFEGTLFTCNTPEQQEKRRKYKALISNPHFLGKVKELHNLFRLCRRYLREFDKERNTSAADVLGLTEFLEKALDKIPVSEVLMTEERLELIKDQFKRGKDGPISGRGIQVRLIEDVHVAACLLHPMKCPKDYQCYEHRFYMFVKRYLNATVIPPPESPDNPTEDELQRQRDRMINEIMNQYGLIHARWMFASSSDRNTDDCDTVLLRDEFAFRSSPLRFWNEKMRVGDCKELCELALRTLSISPSSCAAERSFSTQGRLRTKSRNRLGTDIVRKMMFVKWNMKQDDEPYSCANANLEPLADGLHRESTVAERDDDGEESSDESERDTEESVEEDVCTED